MAQAPRDENRVPTLIGVDNVAFTTPTTVAVDPTTHELMIFDAVSNSLVPSTYDYVSLSYTSTNLTGVIFKTGGSEGTTVSTLTLAYDGSNNLTEVTKT